MLKQYNYMGGVTYRVKEWLRKMLCTEQKWLRKQSGTNVLYCFKWDLIPGIWFVSFVLTLRAKRIQLFSCSHQVFNCYCEVKYTTIIVLNYLKRVIIPYMLSSIYVLKATGSGLPSGDFSSASRDKSQESCQQLSKAQAGSEPLCRSGQSRCLIPTRIEDCTAFVLCTVSFL